MSAPLAPFGHPWGPCWCLVGTLGCGPGPLGPLLWKSLQTGTQNGRRNGDIFNDILSLRRKWQTAFGLRLCSRIRVRAPCFHSLGLHWCPFICSLFVNVFWAQPGTSKSTEFEGRGGVGVRGGTPLFVFKNKAQVTCTSNACFRSATGPSTGSLVGSSLEPAAGSTSPSASTRPREVGV